MDGDFEIGGAGWMDGVVGWGMRRRVGYARPRARSAMWVFGHGLVFFHSSPSV